MADPTQSFVDRRIPDWWQRKAERVNFYWHHLLWVGVLWVLLELSELQHAFPWNLRGATALSDSTGGWMWLAVAVPLGLGGTSCYEWAALQWQRAWTSRVGSHPLFVYGWPAAMLALAGLAALNPYSPLPLRWILGPLNGAVLLWTQRALDFKPRLDRIASLAVIAAAFGFWAWCTIAFSDFMLAILTGANMFLLLSQGRAVIASAIEQYGGKWVALTWTYAWCVPLAALVWLPLMWPPSLYRNAGWVFACWFFTMWGMLATPFNLDRCSGCVFYGLIAAFIVARQLTQVGAHESMAVICSIALALLLGGYFLVEQVRRLPAR